jgi:phage FluMu protein Com
MAMQILDHFIVNHQAEKKPELKTKCPREKTYLEYKTKPRITFTYMRRAGKVFLVDYSDYSK